MKLVELAKKHISQLTDAVREREQLVRMHQQKLTDLTAEIRDLIGQRQAWETAVSEESEASAPVAPRTPELVNSVTNP